MKRLFLLGLIPIALTAAAQPMDHSSMPGMKMQPAGSPSQDHSSMPGMKMPSAQSPQDHSSMPGMKMPSAQSPSQDHSSMPGMNMSAPGHDMAGMAHIEIPHSPPPPPPSDHAADHFYPSTAMASARAELEHEHGGGTVSKVMANLAEYQVRDGSNGYRWDGQAWFGGDIHRFVLKSEGEGTLKEGVEAAELQALYSRAVGVYTDVQRCYPIGSMSRRRLLSQTRESC